jgi:hypothetical protein
MGAPFPSRILKKWLFDFTSQYACKKMKGINYAFLFQCKATPSF